MKHNFWRRLGTGTLVVFIMALIYWAFKSGFVRYEAIRDSVLPAFLWAWWLGDISDKRQARIVARKVRKMSEAEQAQYFEDYPKDKLLVDRINGKYAFGMIVGAIAITSYMWGVEANNPRDSWFRLGIFGFLVVLVLFWLSTAWWPSVLTQREKSVKQWEREVKKWRKIRKKYKHVKTPDDFAVLAAPVLRHRPVDDDPCAALNRANPMTLIAGKNLTHKELVLFIAGCKDEHVKEKLIEAEKNMETYIINLGRKVVEKNAVEPAKE